jgi:hypothetical protein
LEFLPRVAIEHGNRRGGLAKLQLEHREAIQRGIGDRHALPPKQFANLGQPEPVGEPAANRLALRLTLGPAVTARASANGLQREQHIAHLVIRDRLTVSAQPRRGRRAEIPADGLGIEPQLRSEPFRRHARAPES